MVDEVAIVLSTVADYCKLNDDMWRVTGVSGTPHDRTTEASVI
jgi:hypothetical protein